MEGQGIYQDGNSAKQFTCKVVFVGDSLNLYIDNDNKELLIWSVKSFKSCHLNGSSLIINHGSFPHQTLECHGDLAKQIYLAWSDKSVIRQAEGFTVHRGLIAAIAFSIIFIGLGFFIWLFFLPWAGEKAAMMVPKEMEIALGDRISGMYAEENKLNDSASYYLQEFTDRLELDDTYPLKVQVINSKEINAFALPGGRIFVYSGIIERMESYEELVALLGHEITHVVHRHSLKSICRSAATGIVIATLFGDVTGISSGILTQADKFKELDYSRDLETDADNNGLQIMIENEINPVGMLALLKILERESGESPGLMKYLSTHPDTGARIKNIEKNPDSKKVYTAKEELQLLFQKIKQSL